MILLHSGDETNVVSTYTFWKYFVSCRSRIEISKYEAKAFPST
jgi:hypothetical protein